MNNRPIIDIPGIPANPAFGEIPGDAGGAFADPNENDLIVHRPRRSLQTVNADLMMSREQFQEATGDYQSVPMNPGNQTRTLVEAVEAMQKQMEFLTTAAMRTGGHGNETTLQLQNGIRKVQRTNPGIQNLRTTAEIMEKNFNQIKPLSLVTKVPVPGRNSNVQESKCKIPICDGESAQETMIWLDRTTSHCEEARFTEQASIKLMLAKASGGLYTTIKQDEDADLVSIIGQIEKYHGKVPAVEEAQAVLDRTFKTNRQTYSQYINELRTVAGYVVREYPVEQKVAARDRIALMQLKRTLPQHYYDLLKNQEELAVLNGRSKFTLYDYKEKLTKMVDDANKRKERLEVDKQLQFAGATLKSVIPALNDSNKDKNKDKDKDKAVLNLQQQDHVRSELYGAPNRNANFTTAKRSNNDRTFPGQTRLRKFNFIKKGASKTGRRPAFRRSPGSNRPVVPRKVMMLHEDGEYEETDMDFPLNDDEIDVIEEEGFEVEMEGDSAEEDAEEMEDTEEQENVLNVLQERTGSKFPPRNNAVVNIETLIKKANLKNKGDCIKCGLSGHISSQRSQCALAMRPLTYEACVLCGCGLHEPFYCARKSTKSFAHPGDNLNRGIAENWSKGRLVK